MEGEVRMSENGDGEVTGGDETRVSEWEIGLPNDDDLAPLSQSLVPSNLAVAFMITPERSRTIHDVNLASRNTLSSLRTDRSSSGAAAVNASSSNTVVTVEEVDLAGSSSPGSDPKKQKKPDGGGDAAAVEFTVEEGDSETEDQSGKALKRPRLVWTPQLHKRFVDVVTHLGVKNAVPKTIMQLMNVDGLTRENVASHLQKYRLYLKRSQGLTTEDDQLFSVPPPPQNGEAANGNLRIPVPVPSMMPMQGYYNNSHSHEHFQQYYHHGNGVFEPNQYMMQQNKFGSMGTSSSVGGGGVNGK